MEMDFQVVNQGMDGLDWIILQQEGFDDDSLMLPGNGNARTTTAMDQKSDSNPMFQQWNGIASPFILDPPLESLDCLLSASNSQTDDDDDGISALFSDCGTFWNFTAPSKPATPPKHAAIAAGHPPPSKRKRSESDGLDFHFASSKKGKQDGITTPATKSSNISFSQQTSSSAASSGDEPDAEAIAQMKEMIYRAAAFRPVNFGAETVDKPKRKNVRISNDPQTVAARQRRERISERIRVLQKLVPGGSKMDTASMLDEAANYLKFLRSQVKALEALGGGSHGNGIIPNLGFSPFVNLTSFAAAAAAAAAAAFQQPQFSIQQHNPVHRSLS